MPVLHTALQSVHQLYLQTLHPARQATVLPCFWKVAMYHHHNTGDPTGPGTRKKPITRIAISTAIYKIEKNFKTLKIKKQDYGNVLNVLLFMKQYTLPLKNQMHFFFIFFEQIIKYSIKPALPPQQLLCESDSWNVDIELKYLIIWSQTTCQMCL